MKNRYRLISRGSRGGAFYCVDGSTGKRTSLGACSRDEAEQVVLAKNQALRQPALNLQIARAYLGFDRRTSHERLVRVCTNTPDVYSVVIEQPAHPRSSVKILAVGRLIKTPEPYVAMFDLLIGHEAHIPKLARILLHRLITLGRAYRFQILAGKLLSIDQEAIDLCRCLDFAVQDLTEEGTVQVLLKL